MKIKIGIIGAGGIASAHLPHLAAHEDVELSAIADVNTGAAQATADKWRIARVAADYREWLSDVDAVLICVPTHLHSAIAVDCLRAGKATFCEKPLARTREQSLAMRQAQIESGAPLQVGFVRRFDAEWLAWRDAVLANKIGRPLIWRDVMAGAGPHWASWFTQDDAGGGPFLDGCIHNLDFALYTFGPAQWVFAHGRTLRESNTAIDSGSATIRFHSGDELLLAWSWGLPEGCGGTRVFEFLGPQGTIRWPQEAAQDGTRRFVIAPQEESVYFPSNALTQGFKAQMDEFIAVIKGETLPRAGWLEGHDSLMLALALLESARTEEKVKL